MINLRWVLFVALWTAALAGCAPNNAMRSYPAGSAGSSSRVTYGEVLAIEQVFIEGDHSIVGTLGGAAIGNSLGRTIGGGSGKRIAGAVGAVGGAVAGQSIESAVTADTAFEVTVALDSGKVIAIVQNDDLSMRQGDRVRILLGRRSNRVVPI